jgi:nucleotide-binding universal stress UspA family protein
MKTILFPTDFSENAFQASEYAGMLAEKFDANIVIMNCYSVPIMTDINEYQISANVEEYAIQSKKVSEENMANFKQKFMENTNLTEERISYKIIYGFVADAILETTKNINADMIVMGTKGASNVLDKWIGTTAQTIMKQAECPVWVIPHNAKINYPQKFLYAADLLEDEILATQKLMEFVKPLEANCKIIHIDDTFELKVGEQVATSIGELKEEFKNDDNVFVRNIRRDDVVEGIEAYIQSYKPDVLALAVHEKLFFEKIFAQSVTNHFVFGSNIPLLLFQKTSISPSEVGII